jgi:TonB C terminal
VPKGSIEVSTFQPLTVENAPALEPELPSHPLRDYFRARISAIEDRIPGAVVGAVLSVLLHAFLVTSVVWGVAAHSHQRRPVGLSGSARVQGDESQSMQWVMLNMGPSLSPSSESALHVNPKLSDVGLPKVTLRALADVAAELDAGSNDASAPGSSSSTTDSAADGNSLIALAGRYVGQIDARIDRAWLRPRTAIGAGVFACRVRIDQSRTGKVLHVAVERCNGGTRWQRSLVAAIESASPLPQPPKPSVFARTMHMSFESTAYHPGARPGQYEPLRVARASLVVPSAKAAETALSRFGEALKKAHRNEVINLTITGPSAPDVPEGASAQP